MTFPSQVTATTVESAPKSPTQYTVKINAMRSLTLSWDGWGTSLCWWANAFGERDDIADVLFTLENSVSLIGEVSKLPALGLNIVRYNVGGSSKKVIDNAGTEVAMKVPEKMVEFKFIETFWLNWMSNDSKSDSFDWDCDKNQRKMLNSAAKRDANIIEFFSNSPPWWMLINHATAGGEEPMKDNLQKWNHAAFAFYLATVVKQAKKEWGHLVASVELFNEPSSPWWVFPKQQEGCHFEIETQKTVLLQLRQYLDDFKLKNVVISASDENSPELALSTLSLMSKYSKVIDAIGKVNTHGYDGIKPYRGKEREPLRNLVGTLGIKKFWDSEYGDADKSGILLAESIALDINVMGVSGFVYWQALDGGNWGLIEADGVAGTIGSPNTKYFVMAQYSRHIRPGMTILATDDVNTVMAYHQESEVLILVTVNMEEATTAVTFDLSGFQLAPGPVTVWTTETSGLGALYERSQFDLPGLLVTVSIPAASVMTLEIVGARI
ncbi:unnamed protein product [Peronospora belbahrii]|uniref:Endo-beta-1,6-galactanase-like domain-containing protein n=1 Tax=Peronospora belbahrii TaxID=622444 RepID=A0AAU9KYL9_9STRA|nr:unnamed protein product [Peronospora belbahrii]CAH0517011.1 unnamed protein product [Peronospora belbahrii]